MLKSSGGTTCQAWKTPLQLLSVNQGGYSGGCAKEVTRERGLSGVQGGVSHFGIMLVNREDFEAALTLAPEFGGRLVARCEHGGEFLHAYLADPDGYVVEIQYEGSAGCQ